MYPHVQQFETRRVMVDEQLEFARLKADRKPRNGTSRWLMRLKSLAALRSIDGRLARSHTDQ